MMDKFVIQGQTRLDGSVTISGSKNAALPIMAAALLTDDESVIRGAPELADVKHLCDLLTNLGAKVRRDEEKNLHIKVHDETSVLADYETVRKMRASICVLGPLLADGSTLVLQHHEKEHVERSSSRYVVETQRSFGDTVVTFLSAAEPTE